MASFSSHGFSFMGGGFNSSSSNDNEMVEQLFVNMDRQRQCVFACVLVVANSFQMFNVNELNEGVGQ
jgi:inosine/xanthosine triphosphate pyrophosphatase family protein